MVTFDIAQGNPGCLSFMGDAYARRMMDAERALQRMQDNDIKGDKIYMLWNDCCDRDTNKTLDIMLNNTIEDIVEHINYDHGRGIKYK